MKQTSKRMLSILLTLALVLSLLPLSVMAAESNSSLPEAESAYNLQIASENNSIEANRVNALGHIDGSDVEEHPTSNESYLRCNEYVTVSSDPRLEALTLPDSGVSVTFLDDGDYPWVRNGKRLESSNQGKDDTTSGITIDIVAEKESILRFEYGVSSESDWDVLNSYYSSYGGDGNAGGSSFPQISGNEIRTFEFDLAGGHGIHLSFTYRKDGSIADNDDIAFIQNFVISEVVTESESPNDSISWNLNNDDSFTISGTGAMDDYLWVWDRPWDLESCLANSVVIEDGITAIGRNAFSNFRELTNVTIPDSVTCIGDYAFEGCTSLTNVTIPDSVTCIGDYAFEGCTSLTRVTIPDSVTTIGYNAFEDCSNLSTIEVSSFEQLVEACSDSNHALFTAYYKSHPNRSCGKKATWSYHDGILSISGSGAMYNYPDVTPWFDHTEEITKVEISEGITSIGAYSFNHCYNLGEIVIPNSVISIGDEAFLGCYNLTSVTIGNSVTSIGNYTFAQCNLSSVTLPDSVISIGDHAFMYCRNLQTVVLSNRVTSIKDSAFASCYELATVYYDGSYDELNRIVSPGNAYLFIGYFNAQGVTEGTISESVLWRFEDHTLYISGSGKVPNYNLSDYFPTNNKVTPWLHLSAEIEKIIIKDGITAIGEDALPFFSTNYIEIPSSLHDLYAEGLYDGYEGIVRFTGSVPSCLTKYFKYANCTAYYPANDPTWTEDVRQNYGPNITWIAMDHVCPTTQFTDVPKSTNWAHEGIDFAVSNGLFNGMSATTFGPNESMTRAMLVTVLWRLEGQPKPTGTNPFTDVRASQYYADPVVWAAENGIVNGIGNGKFNPNGNITREQLATILYRYSVMKGYDTSARASISGFPDAKKVSSWATDSLSWANATGLITGSSVQGTAYLLPSGNATRAQVATILMRFASSN